MNVTASNAASVLEEWPELVRRCEFYTVDQEMTGIDGDSPMDRAATLDATYKNVSTAVKRFCAFQFGICLFERKDGNTTASLGSDAEYIVRPFSFWLLNDNDTISLSTSAVKFLLKNNMNYQYWLENGFAFGPTDENACPSFEELNEEEQKWVTEQFDAISQWYDNPPPLPGATETSQIEVTQDVASVSTTTSVSDVPATPASIVTDGEPPKKVPTTEKKEDQQKDEYLLSSYVSARADVYLHYLLYAQTGYIPRGQSVPDDVKNTRGRQTVFNAFTSKLLTSRDPRYPRTWFQRLPEGKGIDTLTLRTKVTFHPFFKILIDSKKTHVGHNYLTDLMFEINQHHLPLPEDYKVFRQLLGSKFPSIYDTKVLGQMVGAPSKHSDLGSMFKDYTEKGRKAGVAKKFKFPLGFNDLTRTDLQCAHDGSYDAYMTGIVFLYAVCTSGTKAGIEEGYDKYEGVIAQFASSFWVALRRDEDLPADKVRAIILGLPIPEEDKKAEKNKKAGSPS